MKRILSVFLFFILLTGCAAPAAQTEPSQAQFFSMDTVMTVRVYDGPGEEAVQAARQAVEELDGLLSRTDADSQLSALNAHAGDGISVQLLPGDFDVTIAPVMDAWGFTTDQRQVPDPQTLAGALSLVDSGKLEVDKEASTARLEAAGMEVDLGAVAKGYAAGQAAAAIRDAGSSSALLDLGGNVTALGRKEDGSTWQVGVKDPQDTAQTLCVLSMEDQTASTSGGYERYFEENGIQYHHIIDPKTGYPADSGLLSVTVVSENHMLADALSTALFVAGEDAALEFWRSRTDFELVLCTADSRVVVTQGLEEGLRPTGEERGYTYEIARR